MGKAQSMTINVAVPLHGLDNQSYGAQNAGRAATPGWSRSANIRTPIGHCRARATKLLPELLVTMVMMPMEPLGLLKHVT